MAEVTNACVMFQYCSRQHFYFLFIYFFQFSHLFHDRTICLPLIQHAHAVAYAQKILYRSGAAKASHADVTPSNRAILWLHFFSLAPEVCNSFFFVPAELFSVYVGNVNEDVLHAYLVARRCIYEGALNAYLHGLDVSSLHYFSE